MIADQRCGTSSEKDSGCVVRMIEPVVRTPVTSVELLVIALLRKEREIPLSKLASRVADMFYRGELRAGAWAVDIGLFGRTLFIRDALRVLEAGSGELWEIGNGSRV